MSSKKSAIGICGLGFVGTAVKETFQQAFAVKVYDRNPEKKNVCGLDCLIAETDGPIFVAVPTPMRADGSCDTSIVESVVLALDAACQVLPKDVATNRVVVIKSTIPPGTTERLAGRCSHVKLIFNPEFLTEANFVQDFKDQKRIILGCVCPTGTNGLNDEQYYHATLKVLQHVTEAYHRVLPAAEVVWWNSTSAELFKYVCNTFLALKVSFANELKQLCDKLNVDYDGLVDNLKTDERLGASHWKVPGPDGLLGFGGSCFPKDINGLLALSREVGVDMLTLEAAWTTNLIVRPEKDWEALKGRAVAIE